MMFGRNLKTSPKEKGCIKNWNWDALNLGKEKINIVNRPVLISQMRKMTPAFYIPE